MVVYGLKSCNDHLTEPKLKVLGKEKNKMYEKLKEKLIKENKENLAYAVSKLSTEDKYLDTEQKRFDWVCNTYLNKKSSYKGSVDVQRVKIVNALTSKFEKDLNKELDQLKAIGESKSLPNNLKIVIEWKKSRMWGANPRAIDNYGNDSGSIGGCGYDKRSTALARILNQHSYLIKLMCDKKEEALNSDVKFENDNDLHRKVLGYGSGYGIIPHFEGGVSVNSLITILSRLGFNVEEINTDNTDVYFISFKGGVFNENV